MINSRRRRRHGGSALELCFFLPWFIFLFVGAYDWGFYAHGLVSTANAAKALGHYASKAPGTWNATTGCQLAIGELKIAANINNSLDCTTSPLIVTETDLDGTTGTPTPDGQPAAYVIVQYQSVPVIPVPGLMPGQPTFRSAVMMKFQS